MSVKTLNRRHFLMSSSGFALAIPFLPSLLPRTAQAAPTTEKFLVAMMTPHGGLWPAHILPPDPASMTVQQIYPGVPGVRPDHHIRWGQLPYYNNGSDGVVSDVLKAPASELSASLASKMNVIAGLDITFRVGHNVLQLGNISAETGSQKPELDSLEYQSIDQIIASSASGFYSSTPWNPVVGVAAGFGQRDPFSYKLGSSGSISPVAPTFNSPRDFHDALYALGGGTTASPRQPVLDRVANAYRSLIQSNTRLGVGDKNRLNDYLDMLSDLHGRLSIEPIDCGSGTPPESSSSQRTRAAQYADLIAASIICGATRIATLGIKDQSFVTHSYGDWHQNVAHEGGGSTDALDPSARSKQGQQDVLVQANRNIFREVFVRLCNTLSALDGNGQPFLDAGLVMWVPESGPITHWNINMPVVTAGSASGYLNTGRIIDYRNRANTVLVGKSGWHDLLPGLLYGRFLTTVMHSMGVPESVWDAEVQRVQPAAYANGVRGYGGYVYPSRFSRADPKTECWPEHYYLDGNAPLPFLAV